MTKVNQPSRREIYRMRRKSWWSMPSIHPSGYHPSTPLRRWSCRLFHLLGRGAPLLSPATPKPFTISGKRLGGILNPSILEKIKKLSKFPLWSQKKENQNFGAPNRPAIASLHHKNVNSSTVYLIHPQTNSMASISATTFARWKDINFDSKTMASTVETQP